MACKGCEARRRFLIAGVTTAATVAHAAFLKPVRELLEAMKNRMKLGGLNQLTQEYTNEDGVKLTASSRFGQDEMIIDVPKTEGGEEKEEKKPTEKHAPYLWVGARVLYDTPRSESPARFTLMVIEPGQNQLVTDPLSTQWYYSSDAYLPNLKLDSQDVGMAQYLGPAGRWNYTTFDDDGQMVFTRSLLRHYGGLIFPDAAGPILPAHDPYGTPEGKAARVRPSSVQFPAEFEEVEEWDQVVVLDPDEGGAEPTSHRAGDRQVLARLAQVTGTPIPVVIPGDYIIKVMSIGVPCAVSSAAAPYANYGWDEDVNSAYGNKTIEVEVRVGKEPNTIRRRFTTVLRSHSELFRDMHPFGNLHELPVHCDMGPNPHGPWWVQTAIHANPTANTINVSAQIPDVFAPGASAQLCRRKLWDCYVQIFPPQCLYATGFYGNEAGRQIWEMIALQIRTGTVEPYSIPRRTQAEIQAAANAVIDATSGEGLYHYDPATNVFSPVPVYDLGPDVLGSPNTDFAWEDQFRHLSLSACRGFAKVRLGFGNPLVQDNAFVTDPPGVIEARTACEDCEAFYDTSVWIEVGAPE